MPLIGLGSSDEEALAASPAATVTVLGAAGKTGRECVEYLAAQGTGEIEKGGGGVSCWYGRPVCIMHRGAIFVD